MSSILMTSSCAAAMKEMRFRRMAENKIAVFFIFNSLVFKFKAFFDLICKFAGFLETVS